MSLSHVHRVDAGRRELLHHRGRAGVVAAGNHGLGVRVDLVLLHHEMAEVLVRPLLVRVKGLELVEQLEDLLVGAVAERAQERRREELPAAAALVHEAPHHVVRVEHDLDPRAAVRDDAHREERLAVRVRRALRGDAGAAVQLAHDHALRAVDHERAVLRHHGDLAEEHLLLARLVLVLQAERRVERLRVRLALAQRLLVRELRRLELVLHEVQHVAAVERLDREDFVEDRLEALLLALRGRHVLLEEVVVGLRLDLDQVRRVVHVLQTAEYLAFSFHWLTFL